MTKGIFTGLPGGINTSPPAVITNDLPDFVQVSTVTSPGAYGYSYPPDGGSNPLVGLYDTVDFEIQYWITSPSKHVRFAPSPALEPQVYQPLIIIEFTNIHDEGIHIELTPEFQSNTGTYIASWNSSAAKLNTYATVLIGYFNATNSVALPLGSSDASANSITLDISDGKPWLVLPLGLYRSDIISSSTFSGWVYTGGVSSESMIYDPNNAGISGFVTMGGVTKVTPYLYNPLPVPGTHNSKWYNPSLSELDGKNNVSNNQMASWTYPVPVVETSNPFPPIYENATAFFNLAYYCGGWNGSVLGAPFNLRLYLGNPNIYKGFNYFPYEIGYSLSAYTYSDTPSGTLVSSSTDHTDHGIYQNTYFDITVDVNLNITVSPPLPVLIP